MFEPYSRHRVMSGVVPIRHECLPESVRVYLVQSRVQVPRVKVGFSLEPLGVVRLRHPRAHGCSTNFTGLICSECRVCVRLKVPTERNTGRADVQAASYGLFVSSTRWLSKVH